jgi:hypothetical protein
MKENDIIVIKSLFIKIDYIISVMQRIRSQLGSVPQAGTALNQIRPHSKRAGKAQTLDSSFHCANKPLNNHQFGQ